MGSSLSAVSSAAVDSAVAVLSGSASAANRWDSAASSSARSFSFFVSSLVLCAASARASASFRARSAAASWASASSRAVSAADRCAVASSLADCAAPLARLLRPAACCSAGGGSLVVGAVALVVGEESGDDREHEEGGGDGEKAPEAPVLSGLEGDSSSGLGSFVFVEFVAGLEEGTFGGGERAVSGGVVAAARRLPRKSIASSRPWVCQSWAAVCRERRRRMMSRSSSIHSMSRGHSRSRASWATSTTGSRVTGWTSLTRSRWARNRSMTAGSTAGEFVAGGAAAQVVVVVAG